ncbi:hypothetical protein [Pseudomonas aeruginosa]|uniref:hypothetical protein n=1 Tax=Pseudomonas aeruginosa TaxID=287 RepID=UPI002358AD35|nr:hypothetical protein [Pseudomonas aeruginosa]
MQQLTTAQGAFELTLLNAECARDQFDDLVIEGLSLGIPAEIMTVLRRSGLPQGKLLER